MSIMLMGSAPATGKRGLSAVLMAQFLSAFGDNALLFAALALLTLHRYPDWSPPVLQMLFVGAYIVCAPFVGQLADAFAKGRVMLLANLLKLLGALMIAIGIDPFIGYTLVGIGAAAYSPAKYGILGELTRPAGLVKANGLMEASTIVAILTGAIAGGVLSDWSLTLALWVCVLVYSGAVVTNLFIPILPAARPRMTWRAGALVSHFWRNSVLLWRDSPARFSLVGTSLFWGAGATLRLLLVLWVPVALGITDHAMPTYLNALVAIGIIVGAGVAAVCVSLKQIRRCLPAGVLLGIGVIFFAVQHAVLPAAVLLVMIGACGGFFVVPLNALLQERGQKITGAGQAIAVQNLGENTAMLLMLGLYALAVKAEIPAVGIGIGFGGIFTFAIVALWCRFRYQTPQ